MKKQKYNNVMRMIGEREGISPKEVEREIQRAIDSGFDNMDENVKEGWAKVPFSGERPTPEELLKYMCENLREK